MLAFAFSLMILAAQAPTGEADASSSEASATAATTVAKTRSDPGRLVCRREAKANSRFTTKVCKTAEEWEQRAETARQAFSETQQRPMISLEKGS